MLAERNIDWVLDKIAKRQGDWKFQLKLQEEGNYQEEEWEQDKRITKITGRRAFGEKSISQKASSKAASQTWQGSSGGIVKIDVGENTIVDVEIDRLHGPLVLKDDGGTRLLQPDTKWTKLSTADQKVMAFQAAQVNNRMNSVLAAHFAAIAKLKEAKEFLGLEESERRKRRCEKEQAREPVQWQTVGNDAVFKNHTKVSPGMLYGLEFPWTAEKLEEMGAAWLTKAFHAAGTLESTNEVIELTINEKVKIDAGNNAGKFLFEVKYKHPRKDLHEKLFVKCPFQMTKETMQDRISSSVIKQPMDLIEINTYRLVEACIPRPTPKFYYGDISNTSTNYILITECLAYTGYDGKALDAPLKPYEIEGPYDKCMDWQLRGPAKDYYMLIVKAHAMIAGLDKKGKLIPDKVRTNGMGFVMLTKPEWFGFNPFGGSGDPPSMMKDRLEVAVTFFSVNAKAIFPDYVTNADFIKKFKDTMMKWNAYKQEIMYFKAGHDHDYCAFGHNNLNADNAYFWKNDSDELECGIIDWGGFGYGCLGHKLWWTFNCADYENFCDNLEDYLDAYVSTYKEYGGPKIDKEVLKLQFLLTSLDTTGMMVASVPNCYQMCKPEVWLTVEDRHDPRIAGNIDGKSTLRTTHTVLGTGIRIIEEMKLDEILDNWIQDFYVGKMKCKKKTKEMIYGK